MNWSSVMTHAGPPSDVSCQRKPVVGFSARRTSIISPTGTSRVRLLKVSSTSTALVAPPDGVTAAGAVLFRAFVRLDESVVGPNAGLSVHTPVLMIADGLDAGI